MGEQDWSLTPEAEPCSASLQMKYMYRAPDFNKTSTRLSQHVSNSLSVLRFCHFSGGGDNGMCGLLLCLPLFSNNKKANQAVSQAGELIISSISFEVLC